MALGEGVARPKGILPEAGGRSDGGDGETMINPDELRIEAWPPRKPPGGQHVGSGPSGVKVTHVPSGIEACVDIGRSQFTNREIAVGMIEAALTHPRFR